MTDLIETLKSMCITRARKLTAREVQQMEVDATRRGDLVAAALLQVCISGAVLPETIAAMTKSQAMMVASACLRAGRWDVALAQQALEA